MADQFDATLAAAFPSQALPAAQTGPDAFDQLYGDAFPPSTQAQP